MIIFITYNIPLEAEAIGGNFKEIEKLSIAVLAKLSRLRYSGLRFGLAQPAIVGSQAGVHSRLTHR